MKTVVFAFGRMNPPTTGHQKLVTGLVAHAKKAKATPRIYLSHSVGKKDPLPYDKKIAFAKKAFGAIVKKSPARNVIQILQSLEKEGFKKVVLIAGSDRVPEFTRLLKAYNGKEYNFDEIEVVSAGERDPDADDVSGMSASKLRALAKDEKTAEFMRGAPSTLKTTDKKSLYTAVRKALLGEDVMDYGHDEKFTEFMIESAMKDDDHIEGMPSDAEIKKIIDDMEDDDLDLHDTDALMLDVILGEPDEDDEEDEKEMDEGVGRRWQSFFSPSQDWQSTPSAKDREFGDHDYTINRTTGELNIPNNLMIQLLKIADRTTVDTLQFKDKSKIKLTSAQAKGILNGLRSVKPIEREKIISSKANFMAFKNKLGESVEFDEERKPLSIGQRQKISQRLKRMAKRLARLRQIKAKIMPAQKRIVMRARKAALMSLRKRAAGTRGLNYSELSPSQRIAVDSALYKRFGKNLNKAVDRISKRILPNIRKKAQASVAQARSRSQTNEAVTKQDSPLNVDATKLNPIDNDPMKNDRTASDPKNAHKSKHKKLMHTHLDDDKEIKEARKSAVDKDARDAGDTNIVYQMRKTINSRGEHETVFANGQKASISINDAKKMLARFDSLRMPADKHEFTVEAGKSLSSFRNILMHGLDKSKKSKISLGGRSFREFVEAKSVGGVDPDANDDPNVPRKVDPKLDLLMRLGLVDVDELQKYRRALRSSKKQALQSPEMRKKLADLLDKLLDYTVGDTQTFSRIRYRVQKARSESVDLSKKAEKSGIDVDILNAVFTREIVESNDINRAFNRVNSFIAGGKAATIDSDLAEKVKQPTGGLKDACWTGYTAVGMKMKNGKKVPNCVPEASKCNMTNEGTMCEVHGTKSCPAVTETLQRTADIKMIKVRLPDGRLVMRRESKPTNVQNEQMSKKDWKHHLNPKLSLKHKMKDAKQHVDRDADGDVDKFDKPEFPDEIPVGSEKLNRKMAQKQKGELQHTKIGRAFESKKTPLEIGTDRIRKAYAAATPGQNINEAFSAGFELAPLAHEYGIQAQGGFAHHPDVEAMMDEATYKGKTVPLNKPMKGDVKKSKVYVDPDGDGKAQKVNFGDKKLSIKKNIPARKKSYCARSSGQGNLTDKTKANYWSRRAWDC